MLGVFLIVVGLSGSLRLPDPAVPPVVVDFGALLLPLLPVLWLLSRVPRLELVLALAGANGAGTLVFVLWVLIWGGGFHPAGMALVPSAAGVLAGLATLQARVARDMA